MDKIFELICPLWIIIPSINALGDLTLEKNILKEFDLLDFHYVPSLQKLKYSGIKIPLIPFILSRG